MSRHPFSLAVRRMLIVLGAIGVLALWGFTPRTPVGAQPSPPQPYQPPYGATGVQNPVTVAWYPSYGAVAYDVAWADAAVGTWTWSGYLYNQTSYTLPTLTAGDTYGWYVFACDYYQCVSGGQWYFVMASSGSGAPVAPQQSSPAYGANNVNNPVSFGWAQASGDTNYLVEYEDATAGTGWNASPWLSGTQTSWTAPNLNSGDTYYWLVYGCTSYCAASTVWYFTMGSSAPVAPQLSSPAYGASGVTNPVTLVWSQAGSDTEYVVYYADASAGTGWVGASVPGNQTSYPLPPLTASHVYDWLVYGCTNSCVASPVWYFSMAP
ncbi:MAG TPA: hypothetical protein VK821_18635 [Dehalococcoidia bacterium]|nr:hypothetical protein [Dehalococcoidia bacterium]